MKSVGAYEAKTHLPRLLEAVSRGESFQITKHGTVVAVLVPASPDRQAHVSETIAELRAFRSKRRLGRLSVKAMIEAGRR